MRLQLKALKLQCRGAMPCPDGDPQLPTEHRENTPILSQWLRVQPATWYGAIAKKGMLLRGYDQPRARRYGMVLRCFPLLRN
jgi:hypothetical protein